MPSAQSKFPERVVVKQSENDPSFVLQRLAADYLHKFTIGSIRLDFGRGLRSLIYRQSMLT
jgi:hypothetical protein